MEVIRNALEELQTHNLNHHYQNEMRRKITITTKCDLFFPEIRQDIESMYAEFMRNLSLFYKDMHLENPVHIRTVHANMLNKGQFSYNMCFKYGFNNLVDSLNITGLGIITGVGLCNHIANNLVDCYRAMGLESYGAITKLLSTKKVSQNNILVETPKYLESDFHKIQHLLQILSLLNRLYLGLPNHEVTITKYQDRIYIIDHALNRVLRCDEKGNLYLLDNGSKNMTLIGLDEQIGINAEKKKRAELLAYPSISYEEYRQLHDEGNAIYCYNISEIDDFYYQNAKLYEEITKEIKHLIVLLKNRGFWMLDNTENEVLKDKIKSYNLG